MLHSSAVIAVIGTDIKGVCRYMQEKVNAKLVAFEDGGFRGDYTYGLRAVYKLLAKQIAKDCYKKEEKTYQIIGASAGSYRIRSPRNLAHCRPASCESSVCQMFSSLSHFQLQC